MICALTLSYYTHPSIEQQEGEEEDESDVSDEYRPSDASSEGSGGEEEEEDSDENYTSLSEGDSSGGWGWGWSYNTHADIRTILQSMKKKMEVRKKVVKIGMSWRRRPGKVSPSMHLVRPFTSDASLSSLQRIVRLLTWIMMRTHLA